MSRFAVTVLAAAAALWAVFVLSRFPALAPAEALRSPCEGTRFYALGTIDPRFDLSTTELLSALEQAAAIWNKTQPKPLLAYDPSAKLQVDFVYDERQALEAQAGQFKSQIDERESQLKPELERLNREIAEFKRRQDELNSRIQGWNERGGAPADEIVRIKQEQAALDQEYRRVKSLEGYTRSDAEAVRSQAEVFNQTVKTFNAAIQEKPEQGLYESGKDHVSIFFGSDRAELVHTLAHELGHALGLMHTAAASGIMYPRTTQSLALSDDDLRELAGRCSKRLPASQIAARR